MRIGRAILLAAARNQTLNDFALHSAFVKRATRKFMPGEHVDDALMAGATIARSGRGLIFTQLGEAITSADAASQVRDHYIDLFDRIRSANLPAHVSVKPTQLGLDLSFPECERNLQTLAAKAEETGSALWLDMEDSSYVDRTLDLYEAVKRNHSSTGIALQAYLRRTPRDIERVMPLNPVIRLVKGAYDEPPKIAFEKKSETDAAYFTLASRLLDCALDAACKPIFGTHDLELIGRITDRANQSGVGDNAYEIHMLYGIRDSAQIRLAEQGHIVKTLISYGAAWYRWYMRRLAERPANVLFVVKSVFG